MKRYFLGIDIGTFESRGILIDESFRVAADASLPHGMNNPQPGWFEQEAEAVWWGDLCKLCRTLIKQSGIRPEQIACVGTSALGTDCLRWTNSAARCAGHPLRHRRPRIRGSGVADRALRTGAGAGAVRPSHLLRRHSHKDPLAAAA